MSKKKLKKEDLPQEEAAAAAAEDGAEEKAPARDLTEGITLEDYPLGDDDNPLQQLLEETQKQLAEEKDRYLRLFADFDNYKKRILKEKNDICEHGQEGIIKDILPILDNLSRALASARKQKEEGGGDLGAIIDGLELIFNQWTALLARYGVKPIEALEKPFDPNLHDAIGQVETGECDQGKVISEAERGYMFKNRLLRPARVIVGRAPAAKKEIEVEATEESQGDSDGHQ